jgi:ribosomal protein S18 acetylase RimI-like enzyme
MEHVLDNPGWNALSSGNKNLAHGNDEVKHFAPDISPFVGMRDNSDEQFQMLYDMIDHDGPIGFVSSTGREAPKNWKLISPNKAYQMVYEPSAIPAEVEIGLTPLTEEHTPQMLALTKLTNPGPFAPRTIDFGHYYGVFDGDKLVAMAGQRLHIYEYTEISAVCTHPDYLGRGYAKQLLLSHIHRMRAVGNVPILHVKDSNERAIKVYESIGFKHRTEIYFNILLKVK